MCHYLAHDVKLPTFSSNKLVCPHFVDCTTSAVILLWLCQCGSVYVSKTIRPFQIHICEHLYATPICDLLSPIGRHRALQHEYRPLNMLFTALDKVHADACGGDLDRAVPNCEARWMYCLSATHPPGLNEALSSKPFILFPLSHSFLPLFLFLFCFILSCFVLFVDCLGN